MIKAKAYKSEVKADLAAMVARLGEDSECETASDKGEEGLGCVEGGFCLLIVALFNAHGEGCVLAQRLVRRECSASVRGVSVGGSNVVEVYVHKWRGVYR